jgi:hypothetical protein
MLSYPVHRQMFPDSASRISGSSGAGFSSSRAVICMRKPGVQKPHRLLQWTQPSVLRQALHRSNVAALGLDRQHETRTGRGPVDDDGAGAADPVLAPQVGTGETKVLAQEISERPACLDSAATVFTVHGDLDVQ